MQTLTVCGFLLIAYSQVSFGDFPDAYFTWSDELCFDELGLDKQVVKNAFNENFILEEGHPQINKFVACTFRKANYLNEDGSLNIDNLKKWVRRDFFIVLDLSDVKHKDEIVDKAMTACKTVEGVDVGDTALKVYNCLMDHIRLAL